MTATTQKYTSAIEFVKKARNNYVVNSGKSPKFIVAGDQLMSRLEFEILGQEAIGSQLEYWDGLIVVRIVSSNILVFGQ